MTAASVVVAAALTLTHTIADVGHFFASQPMLADFGLYPLALVAVRYRVGCADAAISGVAAGSGVTEL